MKRCILFARGWHTIACLLGLLMMTIPSFAFDTGHHADLTREVLHEFGFGRTPTDIAQVENWLTDYYTTSPTSSITADVEKLHFDNLFSTEAVRNYWNRLTVNTKGAVQQAVQENNPLKMLTVLGVSLHTVQDFYAHSNWAEMHTLTGGSYGAETWFDAPPEQESLLIYTGSYPDMKPGAQEKHGDYTSGLNKDSYVRPHWDQAYVLAHVASRQWVSAVRGWVNEVNPAFWSAVQNFEVSGSDRDDLDYDIQASYRISEWIDVSGANGHWKGNGSGSNSDFVPFFLEWTASHDSLFVQQFKELHIPRLVSQGLDNPQPTAAPAVARLPYDQKAIIVRTFSVAEKDDVGFFEFKIDPFGDADFYAVITVAGQEFVETMQLDQSSVNPSWTTIRFVPASTTSVPIHYELWDEDGGLRGDDDHCDINPQEGRRDLDFTFALNSHLCTGDVSGTHDSETNAVFSDGHKHDSDRAEIRFYVTEARLESRPPPAEPLPAVRVIRGGFRYQRASKQWVQQVTLINTGVLDIIAPISLVLDNLSSNASLVNVDGLTARTLPVKSPYVTLPSSLPAGARVAVTLKFNNADSPLSITYDTRVLGPGTR